MVAGRSSTPGGGGDTRATNSGQFSTAGRLEANTPPIGAMEPPPPPPAPKTVQRPSTHWKTVVWKPNVWLHLKGSTYLTCASTSGVGPEHTGKLQPGCRCRSVLTPSATGAPKPCARPLSPTLPSRRSQEYKSTKQAEVNPSLPTDLWSTVMSFKSTVAGMRPEVVALPIVLTKSWFCAS